MTHALRRAAVVLVTTAAALGWVVVPADATSYRFWSYWTGGADWTFASQGASRRPPDGAVEGWRFAISEASSSTIPPRYSPSFSRLCGDTDPVEGSKRVGLVIDSGTAEDAPDGESPPTLAATCVVVPTDASGYQVLAAAGAQLRTDSGLICGINGYPAVECGTPVADPEPSDDGGSDDGSGGGSGGDPAGGSGQPSGGGTTGGQQSTSTAGQDADTPRGGGGSDKSAGTDRKKASTLRSPTPTDSSSALAAVAPAAAASTAATDSGSPIGVLVGFVAVTALGFAAWLLRRRRA